MSLLTEDYGLTTTALKNAVRSYVEKFGDGKMSKMKTTVIAGCVEYMNLFPTMEKTKDGGFKNLFCAVAIYQEIMREERSKNSPVNLILKALDKKTEDRLVKINELVEAGAEVMDDFIKGMKVNLSNLGRG